MPVTEAEFRARTLEKARAVAPPRQINEAFLRQAAVDAAFLTNHPAWDKYLSRLQVDLDEANASLQSWTGKVAGAYADADLRMVQVQVNVFTDRVATLTHCMALPKEILAHAHETLDKSAE